MTHFLLTTDYVSFLLCRCQTDIFWASLVFFVMWQEFVFKWIYHIWINQTSIQVSTPFKADEEKRETSVIGKGLKLILKSMGFFSLPKDLYLCFLCNYGVCHLNWWRKLCSFVLALRPQYIKINIVPKNCIFEVILSPQWQFNTSNITTSDPLNSFLLKHLLV